MTEKEFEMVNAPVYVKFKKNLVKLYENKKMETTGTDKSYTNMLNEISGNIFEIKSTKRIGYDWYSALTNKEVGRGYVVYSFYIEKIILKETQPEYYL